MKKSWFTIFFFLIGMVIISDVWAAKPTHADRISTYKGTETCLTCHFKAAKEFVSSLHYQQQAEPQFVKDWPKGKLAGMMLSY